MSNDDVLRYLPPGWTEEKWASATEEDYESLPDDVLERNMQRMAAESKIISEQFSTKMNANRAERGLPSIGENRAQQQHPLVKHIEHNGYEDFGFMLFRTDFSDDARWEQFLEQYDPILTAEMDRLAAQTGPPRDNGSGGVDRIKDKFFMKIVDDDILRGGVGPRDVARAFQMFKAEEEVEPGLDTTMCLMADAECIDSVLDRKSSTDIPFVKAVDVSLDEDDFQRLPDSEGYTGCFKASIASLVIEFYTALHTFDTPEELAALANPVWEDCYGSLQDMLDGYEDCDSSTELRT